MKRRMLQATAGVILLALGFLTHTLRAQSGLALQARMYAGITVTGAVNTVFALQATTNLSDPYGWLTLTNVALADSPWVYIDYDSPGIFLRYYRTVETNANTSTNVNIAETNYVDNLNVSNTGAFGDLFVNSNATVTKTNFTDYSITTNGGMFGEIWVNKNGIFAKTNFSDYTVTTNTGTFGELLVKNNSVITKTNYSNYLVVSNNLSTLTVTDKGYAGAARLAMGYRDLFVYDDFDRPDQTLQGNLTPTGQQWMLKGPGASIACITNGIYTSSSNVYAYLDYGKPIRRIEGTFSFLPGLGNNVPSACVLALIADHTNSLGDMLHLIISPLSWTLQKRVSAGSFDIIAGGALSLLTDGTPYHVAMDISGRNVVVQAPDGTFTTITDPDIVTIAPKQGCWQIRPLVDAYVGRWHSASMGYSIAPTTAAQGAAAPMADLTLLKGAGLSRRQTVQTTLGDGVGWYRIATHSALATYAISGRVTISANAASVGGALQVAANYILFKEDPTLAQLHYASYYSPITQMRLSSDGATEIGLDITTVRS